MTMKKKIIKFSIKHHLYGLMPMEYFYNDELTLTSNSFRYVLNPQDGIFDENISEDIKENIINAILNNEKEDLYYLPVYPYKKLNYDINSYRYMADYIKICEKLIEAVNDDCLRDCFSTDVGSVEFDIYYDDGSNDNMVFEVPNGWFYDLFNDIKLLIDKYFFNVPNVLDTGCYDYPKIEDNPQNKYYFPGFEEEITLQDYIETTKDKYEKYKLNLKGYLQDKGFVDEVIDNTMKDFSNEILDTYLNRFEFHNLMEDLEYFCNSYKTIKDKETLTKNG